MKLIEIVNKIDVKKINVKKDEFHKLEDIQILKIEEERRKMAKNSLLFLDKAEIEKLNNNEIKILINDLREKEVKAIVLETDTQNLKEIEKEFSEEEKDILGIFDDEKKKEKDDVMLLDIDDIIEEEPIKASGIPGAVPINIVEDDETFLERDRPKPDDYNLDIEKELENKFDELFGSLE